MEQIGFKNFRRFIELPVIKLAPITIFVGGNNAGKSTVVKGLLALYDFLKGKHNFEGDYNYSMYETTQEYEKIMKEKLSDLRFYFNTSYLAHIGTFKRALNNKVNNSTIVFYTTINNIDITINIVGDIKDEELVWGKVCLIELQDNIYNLKIVFNINDDIAEITFNPRKEFQSIQSLSPRFQNMLDTYFNCIDKPITIDSPISPYIRGYRRDLLGSLIDALENAINQTINLDKIKEREYDRGRHGCIKPIDGIEPKKISFLKQISEKMPVYSNYIERNFSGFRIPIARSLRFWDFDIEYLYAHSVSQTVIYSAKDTNDYLSRTIHEFASQQKKYSKRQKEFIVEWMKEFGVGVDYNIRSVGGEAHIVTITNNDGEKVNLADKGMGSIQLMVLLFRLAINLPNKREARLYNAKCRRIVIIEEPEQNLHPRLQSKLADFFYKLNSEFGFRFLIETHSEYLIRRSQILVANAQYKNEEELILKNPFKIYYFPEEREPYEMKYKTDGRFSNEFDSGFFDEASNLAFELF